MSAITSVTNPALSALTRLADSPLAPGTIGRSAGAAAPAPANGFGEVFDKFVSAVNDKQTQAQDVTRSVLLGDNDQLHQSVIAMQEASVAFNLMVQVRNKLVDSYQELMRMPA